MPLIIERCHNQMTTYKRIDGSHLYLCNYYKLKECLYTSLFDQLVPAKPSIFNRCIFYREAYAFILQNMLALYFSRCEFISQLEQVKLNKSGSTTTPFLSAFVTNQYYNSTSLSVHLGFVRQVPTKFEME
ncbi:Hypothetical_protein [Hexamita inflata]|uniref:Hypothetical_protein n=1 Tax=Hexamita inflata TaxID=28002 RepID=A0AA86Q3N6_9EUKA|nr:Hypothetical protein HINF_LOCUS36743 [Hexamita inflata]